MDGIAHARPATTPLLLPLLLLCKVLAVILNAVKDPESPNPPRLPSFPTRISTVVAFLQHTPKNVISPKLLNGIIVSSAVEKSASPPHLSPAQITCTCVSIKNREQT
jgi:hypothetical protein